MIVVSSVFTLFLLPRYRWSCPRLCLDVYSWLIITKLVSQWVWLSLDIPFVVMYQTKQNILNSFTNIIINYKSWLVESLPKCYWAPEMNSFFLIVMVVMSVSRTNQLMNVSGNWYCISFSPALHCLVLLFLSSDIGMTRFHLCSISACRL